ncbi:quinone-dependent dihydroorotate dehydrogenase [Hydrogenophilus thiooxidans]|uniref:quinone-dependent dihydroorotate dehydrogenase n=1 Tax=Hydrogenophilus thiooxidans TaxID=2820326 RepID=UPI002017D5CE|nr:quinone-dependent dihydroorotate dehydrogenase [Hydrogenophilus thiooxidans]
MALPPIPYALVRPLLFALDPEEAHERTLAALSRYGKWVAPPPPPEAAPVTVMGLRFPNRVGLAAGLDKNGIAVDGLAHLGFGAIEVGTVTPRPQPGNPKPRLFRIPEREALINRMGFNNDGVDALVAHLRHRRFRGILGINLGKNATTPIEAALDDYRLGLQAVWAVADYVTINISSPNTQQLRALQERDALAALLDGLKEETVRLEAQSGKRTPLVVKIAPDLDESAIAAIAETLVSFEIDGVIATNTTIARDEVAHLPHGNETGGLSGRPLFARSTAVVRALAEALQGKIPIIAAGGIVCGDDARAKLAAGATLVQLYTGLIYRGPKLIAETIAATAAECSRPKGVAA